MSRVSVSAAEPAPAPPPGDQTEKPPTEATPGEETEKQQQSGPSDKVCVRVCVCMCVWPRGHGRSDAACPSNRTDATHITTDGFLGNTRPVNVLHPRTNQQTPVLGDASQGDFLSTQKMLRSNSPSLLHLLSSQDSVHVFSFVWRESWGPSGDFIVSFSKS